MLRRWIVILPVIAGLAVPAAAQDTLVPAGAVSAFASSYATDKAPGYRAMLVETEDGADLYVFNAADVGQELAAHAPNIAWRGGMFGQQPELEVAENGSLRVVSMNESIGRNRWRQVLTIAWRGGQYVVAGYTYSYWDTLEPDSSGECDVNLLTGRGVRKSGAFKTAQAALPVGDWTMDTQPEECFR